MADIDLAASPVAPPRDEDELDSFVVVKQAVPEEMGRVGRLIRLLLKAVTTPPTPAAGGLRVFAKDALGSPRTAFIDPDANVSMLMPSISREVFHAFTDCVSGTAQEFAGGNAGTGSAVQTLITPDGSIGWLRGNLGTAATNRATWGSVNGGVLRFGLAITRFWSRMRVPVLSDATNNFTLRMGFVDSLTADSVDGAYFRYNHAVNSGKWQAVTRSNNVETAADTGVTVVANTVDRFEIRVNAAGTSVDFLIDDVVVATITTNIPVGSGRETGYGLNGNRTAGTAALNGWDLDYMGVEQWQPGR
jgi:hypothetical protein